jgi:hypothetical protein
MANPDPMGGGPAVPLSIPPEQAEFLRRKLPGLKAGLEEDLENLPDRANAGRWRTDVEAYERLIDGLDAGEIVPDDHVRRLAREWIEAHDSAEHYERVVFEHNAILTLCAQIGAGQ